MWVEFLTYVFKISFPKYPGICAHSIQESSKNTLVLVFLLSLRTEYVWGGGRPSSGRNAQLLHSPLSGVRAEKNEIISIFPWILPRTIHIFPGKVSARVLLIRTLLYNQNGRILKPSLILTLPKEWKDPVFPPHAACVRMRYVMLLSHSISGYHQEGKHSRNPGWRHVKVKQIWPQKKTVYRAQPETKMVTSH